MYFIHNGASAVETLIAGRGATPQDALRNYIFEWGANARLAEDIARELGIDDIYSGMAISCIAHAADEADVVVVWSDTFLECGAIGYIARNMAISRFDTEEAFRERWCEVQTTDDAA